MKNPCLANNTFYFVVRVAGTNYNGEKDCFVATNCDYDTQPEAEAVAADLSKKTPGNRYYVTKIVSGYLSTEPKRKSYA